MPFLFSSAQVLLPGDSSEDPEMDLPAIHISLNDCTLEEIHDGATGIPYEGNTLDLDGKEYTNVRVKGRGNSSWKMPRRSYQIKLPNRDSVLGMPPAKKASHRQLCRRLYDAATSSCMIWPGR